MVVFINVEKVTFHFHLKQVVTYQHCEVCFVLAESDAEDLELFLVSFICVFDKTGKWNNNFLLFCVRVLVVNLDVLAGSQEILVL